MNMFAKNSAKSIQEYLDNVPEDRKEAVVALHELIKKTVPNLESHFATNMLGYGSFKYIDYKKQEKDWPIIALANQKNYISLYVCAVEGDQYLAEKFEKDLGKVSIGKSCIRFKKLEDLNLETIKKVLRLSEKTPGLVGTQTKK